ncbi:MAG: hypothetical protein NTZ23_05675 [Cyanobium sp. LacPavin_0920_WC12_MAG_63_22]|nr:hypothetical protein [Cyanobium sp. LacPavin_0920_WC12_MAG_63_22]
MTQLLLDTNALLWWLAEPNRLSPAAHAAISDPFDRLLAAQRCRPSIAGFPGSST